MKVKIKKVYHLELDEQEAAFMCTINRDFANSNDPRSALKDFAKVVEDTFDWAEESEVPF